MLSRTLRRVDAHHHFLKPSAPWHAFLKSNGAPEYLPHHYARDAEKLAFDKTVHVECMPDDPVAEVNWVASLADCRVAAIVAACDLSAPDVAARLDAVQAASERVRGIRYILDYDGPFGEAGNATHVACSRHGRDYLRDPVASAEFERGVALLADRKLSFDLQCAPAQLPAASEMFRRHPRLKVVIDHMGKPFRLQADGGEGDARTLAEWRRGMEAMARLPQVYVKLSMLGFSVPGWCDDEKKEALLRSLVLEVIERFGASRCMFASNWHVSGALSDSDSPAAPDVSMEALFASYESWVSHLSPPDVQALFATTAEEFYCI